MTAAAASVLQPVAHALLRVVAGVPTIVTGRGFLAPTRVGAAGGFSLRFDRSLQPPPDPVSIGLPGDMSVPLRHLRSHVTVRGTGAPPGTTIVGASAAVTDVPGEGGVALVVTTSNAAGAPVDPSGATADGIEVLVFRAAEDDTSAQFAGPLFQPFFPFP